MKGEGKDKLGFSLALKGKIVYDEPHRKRK